MVGMEPTMPWRPGEPVIVNIGEIAVSSTTIHTPAGSFPLRGSQWNITDQWNMTQKIPQWAIVMSIVGFFCLTVFSLLFLLARETVYNGMVTITVGNGQYTYVTRIPVISQQHVQQIYGQVNYVRALALV
jgi:hypothetical protein